MSSFDFLNNDGGGGGRGRGGDVCTQATGCMH